MRVFAGLLCCACLALAGCGSSGGSRRVSEPAASIQQLTVLPNGSWSVVLRLDNYSAVPMRFDNVSLGVTVDGENAGTLQGQPRIGIGGEAADVATLSLNPLPPVRLRLADALASGRGIAYSLRGTIDAAPNDGGARSYAIKFDSRLNPVPGLPGVLR